MDERELQDRVDRELEDCSPEQREYFASTRVPPCRWRLTPWGDETCGFWVVAVDAHRVLWWNEIEEGFNVSTFRARGEIPTEEYWCKQDELRWALPFLAGKPGVRLGAPQSIPDPDRSPDPQ
jgi:hypothetical protein